MRFVEAAGVTTHVETWGAGEPVFVYGDPPRLSPEHAFVSPVGKLARVAPWIAVALTVAAGALYAWAV